MEPNGQLTLPPKYPARAFKLRFAAAREPGRSNVTAFRLPPFRLPALVTGKVGAGEVAAPLSLQQGAERRLRRALDATHLAPLTSHQYGLWSGVGGRWHECPWLHHHIVDSPWLKVQLRVVTKDASFRR